MPTFLVIRRQSGPEFDPGLPLEEQSGWAAHAAFMDALAADGFILFGGPLTGGRVAFAVRAESAEAVRARLSADPWHDSHLVLDEVEPWTIRLDSRSSPA